ncbi:type IV pilin [Methanosarcina vacuolata]|uniref:Archaeal Type IV pilin N-terminal domain-containing protein n=1 Tax=Methanosarcina vacuolata Z-761 TaxID=1434123 RepID=A0A0E3LGM6_9EURY|nr:type IV pilin [Methanosarcina vacuolata]AKB42786.1 hypothetical protein MSVAZ_0517 [Methanosarcina vacuolata Z-761]
MDFKKLFRKDDKAVSPVIGVILMVAITVILAAAIGSSVFSKGTAESAPQASLDIKSAGSNNTNAYLKFEHLGGESINFEDSAVTKVMASVNGTDAVEIKATDLGTFDVGDVQTIMLSNTGGTPIISDVKGNTVNIKIIDAQTNQLICDKDVRF